MQKRRAIGILGAGEDGRSWRVERAAVPEVLAICVLTLLGLLGCAWTVVPPERVADPVPVFVSEYGRHSRLALPDRTVAFLEYGFGEWNFYGLEKQDAFSGLRAITGLGAGAFSRRELPYTLIDYEFIRAAGSARSVRLLVEHTLADDLRGELERRWRSNAAVTVVRARDQIPVSRDREAYHLFDNSNHAVARWLERLGCRIRGSPITSNFKVAMESDVAVHQSPRPGGGETP
jgi:hypothetical protein